MKRVLTLFTVLLLSLSVFIPGGSVNAQLKEGSTDVNSIELDKQIVVDEFLLNGDQEFSIVEPSFSNPLYEEDEHNISPAYVSFTSLKVGAVKGIGGVRGSFTVRSPAPVMSVNVTMKFNYRKNWLGSWTTVNTVPFNYSGGLGPEEHQEKTYRTSTAGQYRVCVAGSMNTTKGRYNLNGCSMAMSHDGKPY